MSTLNAVNKNTVAKTYGIGFSTNPCTLIVSAGSGALLGEVQLDVTSDEWVAFNTYDADGVYKVEANGCNVRFTPSGGAEFTFIRP